MSGGTQDDQQQTPVVPTSFVLEVVERANDRLLDRIDALDSFFGVLMTAILAVALLALDRFRLLGNYPDVAWGWASIAFLVLAFACAVAGWLRGNDVLLRKLFRYGSEEEHDAPIPRRFIWAVGTKGERALTDTIRAIDRSFTANLPIRTYKRHLAAAALVLLLFGTISAGVAKVVYLATWHPR
jgi:H+/Cl- antiporter ClcA